MEEQQEKAASKSLQIWAFCLSIWSILFLWVPFLNFGPAILAIVLSANARARKNLKKLSTAALILSIIATVGTAQVTFSLLTTTLNNKVQPCSEAEKALEPLKQSMTLWEESVRIQNLTGFTDEDGTRRILMVMQADLDKLLAVDGPAEFIVIRDEIHSSESSLFAQMNAAIDGNMDHGAAQAAEDASILAINKLVEFCE